MGQVWQALFMSIVLATWLPFQCYTHPNGKSSVQAFPDVVCGEGDHGVLVALGVVFTLVYGVGFAALCLVANFIAPERSAKDPTFVMCFRFLLGRFRVDRWYWGSVLMLRALLMAMVPISFTDSTFKQLVMLITLLTGFLIAQCHHQPWKAQVLNMADTTVLAMTMLIAGASSAFVESSGSVAGLTGFIVAVAGIALLSISGVMGHGLMSLLAGLRNPAARTASVRKQATALAEDLLKVSAKLQRINASAIADVLVDCSGYDRKVLAEFYGIMTKELGVHVQDSGSQGLKRSTSRRISVSHRTASRANGEDSSDAAVVAGSGGLQTTTDTTVVAAAAAAAAASAAAAGRGEVECQEVESDPGMAHF